MAPVERHNSEVPLLIVLFLKFRALLPFVCTGNSFPTDSISLPVKNKFTYSCYLWTSVPKFCTNWTYFEKCRHPSLKKDLHSKQMSVDCSNENMWLSLFINQTNEYLQRNRTKYLNGPKTYNNHWNFIKSKQYFFLAGLGAGGYLSWWTLQWLMIFDEIRTSSKIHLVISSNLFCCNDPPQMVMPQVPERNTFRMKLF